jgi:hypothetical protein
MLSGRRCDRYDRSFGDELLFGNRSETCLDSGGRRFIGSSRNAHADDCSRDFSSWRLIGRAPFSIASFRKTTLA